jgi:hypothetical protein
MSMCHASSFGPLAFALATIAQCVPAQCSALVLPGTGINGVSSNWAAGSVHAMTMWDPDGAGPLVPRLVFGGTFTQAGDKFTTNIAAWDPATGEWHAFGPGLAGAYVHALAVLPSGELVAAGSLDPLTGTVPEYIARWTGTAWTSLGGGCNAAIQALHVTPTGNLVAGGNFTTAGTVAASGIAVWNGNSWQSLGGGVAGYVTMLGTDSNGDVLAGGDFTSAGGIAANRIARWNGATWQPLGSGLAGTPLCMTWIGSDLVVGGSQVGPGGVGRVARWNGSTWAAIGGTGPDNLVHAMRTDANGDLIVGGAFVLCNGVPIPGLARWNGTAWSAVTPTSPGAVNDLLTLATGELVVACPHQSGNTFSGIGRWNGTQWVSLTPGTSTGSQVLRVVPLADGGYLAAGRFTAIEGVAANGIARWNGTTWLPLGAGCDNAVFDAVELPNGHIIVSGQFAHAGGINSPTIARWDGNTWHAMPSPGFAVGTRLLRRTNGDLVIALFPSLEIRRFDGTSWSTIGAGVNTALRLSMVETPNGDLVIGGTFVSVSSVPANNIARWDGATWHPLGPGFNSSVEALYVLPDGSLIAGCQASTTPASIARWTGSTWTSLGGPFAASTLAFTTTVSGDLIAAGTDSLSMPTLHPLQRRIGTTWTPLLGASTSPATNAWIFDIARIGDGDIVVGGVFTTLDGVVATNFARITTTCPANVVAAGSGCGTTTLTADQPWTGTTWTSRASNLPPAALVFAAFGFTATTLPLANVFATALPGCTLHVTPDTVTMTLATNGAVATQYPLPANPALAGITFHHQMVSLALDATLAVTATNALQLTVGTW